MLVIDGADIHSEEDFHKLLSGHPKVPEFYGRNLDALWDAIAGLIERPFEIVWFNSEQSKAALGNRFEKIIGILHEAELEDLKTTLQDAQRFRFHLLTGPLQIPSKLNP